jgi:hypothetical protein
MLWPVLDLDRPAAYHPRPRTRRRVLGALVGVAGAVALTNGVPGVCRTLARSQHGAWGSYAGPVPGRNAYLLIAVDAAGDAIAHVCDESGLALWFTGRADRGALVLSGTRQGLVARISGNRVEGTVVLGGTARHFAVGRTAPGGGLFLARTTVDRTVYVGSWIVLGHGRQRGALTVGGLRVPAPALGPRGATTSDGVRLEPVRLDQFSRKWGRLTLLP